MCGAALPAEPHPASFFLTDLDVTNRVARNEYTATLGVGELKRRTIHGVGQLLVDICRCEIRLNNDLSRHVLYADANLHADLQGI